MKSTTSHPAASKCSDWCDEVNDSIREVEDFYKNRTDIPYSLRRDTAKESLRRLEPAGSFNTYTVLERWDEVLRARKNDTPTRQNSQAHRYAESLKTAANRVRAWESVASDMTNPTLQKGTDSRSAEPEGTQLLGQTLLQAGLINRHQIEVALMDAQYRTDLKFGEILAARGWVAQETADFFAEKLPYLPEDCQKELIGQYLKAARAIGR